MFVISNTVVIVPIVLDNIGPTVYYHLMCADLGIGYQSVMYHCTVGFLPISVRLNLPHPCVMLVRFVAP